jgi:hypothetical protein
VPCIIVATGTAVRTTAALTTAYPGRAYWPTGYAPAYRAALAIGAALAHGGRTSYKAPLAYKGPTLGVCLLWPIEPSRSTDPEARGFTL